MAAAPVISDARVPCPLCGGLIHPVAGRCKHCKEDLAALRNGRPQAAAPLPTLGPVVAPALGIATPIEIAAYEPSQPILPPRPTGRSTAVPQPGASWRNWPVIVIILAVVAIVGAVVVMVWPASADAGKHALQPPAPERMDSNPLPPGGAADPWSGHSQIDPPPPPRHVPDPLPPEPPKPDDDTDVFGGIVGGQVGGMQMPHGADFLMTAMRHACERLTTCPSPDQMLVASCQMLQSMPQAPAPTCAAGQRCLEAIDQLSCNQSGVTTPQSLVLTFHDCTTAMTTC